MRPHPLYPPDLAFVNMLRRDGSVERDETPTMKAALKRKPILTNIIIEGLRNSRKVERRVWSSDGTSAIDKNSCCQKACVSLKKTLLPIGSSTDNSKNPFSMK